MRPILEENVRFKKIQRCINLSSLYTYEIRPMLKENVRFKKNQRSINLSSLYNYEIRPMLKKNVRFKKSQRGILIVTELIIDHFLERVKYQEKGMMMNEILFHEIWILGLNAAVTSHIYKWR